jgi:methyl-accepting chemotaxis protein
MVEPAPAIAPAGRHQRRLRNYLLDSRFQLKYTGYLVAIAVVLCAVLGGVLWKTNEAVFAQSKEAVAQGEQLVRVGQDVIAESEKVGKVVEMNIVKVPDYADNPELLEEFKAEAAERDEWIAQQQEKLQNQANALKVQSQDILQRQRTMLTTLAVVLVLMVIGIGLAGILVTHRIVGPVFKVKRHLREVRDGHLKIPGKLRPGDELVDLFETFEEMVRALRSRQEQEIAMLDRAIASLEGKAAPDALEPLHALRREMSDALETEPPSRPFRAA